MRKNQILIALLIWILISLGIGIWIGQIGSWQAWAIISALSFIISIWCPNKLQLIFLLLGITCLALTRTWFVPHSPQPDDIDFYIKNNETNKSVAVTGTICEEPDIRHNMTKYTVCTDKILQNKTEKEVQGKLLLTTEKWPEYHYGDQIQAIGALVAPFVNEEFNYQKYLARYGIYVEIRTRKIKKIGEGEKNWFYNQILLFKIFYAEIINRVFPEPQAAFLDGLLRGARKGLPAEIYDEFQKTGLTHIIAVSGFNITIIAAAMMAIFGHISRRFAATTTVAGIIFFVIFTGMGAAVVRAGLMGGIAAFSVLTGRQSHATTALLLAAVIMNLWQPLILFYDVGFQLSFLATAGLIFISPHLNEWTSWFPDTFGLKEAFLLTISAQIIVVPLIAYHFGRLSLISSLANVAVAPFIVLAMATGFFAVLGGMFSVELGIFLGIPVYLALNVILKIAHYGAQVSWADIKFTMPLWMMICYYLVLIIILGWLGKESNQNRS